jgi:hypothetical protein
MALNYVHGGGKAKSDAVIGQRVVNKTRLHYEQTFKFITRYCNENIPGSCNEDGDLIIPINQEHLETFFGDMSADIDDSGKVKSHSTLTGYVTAIKHYYKENRIAIDFETNAYLKDFGKGFKRVVAQKKNEGIMKNFEGKIGVTFIIYCKLAKLALFACSARSAFASLVHLFFTLFISITCVSP